MATDWGGTPEIKVLASGTLAIAETNKFGAEVFKPWKCSWMIEVPSGCLEPDSESDLWKIVDCGATVKDHPEFPGHGWKCVAGHEHIDIEIAWTDERLLAQEIEAERRAEMAWDRGPSSRFATW